MTFKHSQRILLIGLIGLFFSYALILASYSIAGFPTAMQMNTRMPFLSDQPVGEDGFYYLTIAWNIAQGKGIVYNFDLTTTGFQPLIVGIFSLLARLVQWLQGDKWSFIRGVILFGALTQVVFAYLIARIVRTIDSVNPSQSFLVAFIFSLFNFSLFRTFTYGLETGIYLISIVTMILFWIESGETTRTKFKTAARLGLLFGITILCRIDFIGMMILFLFFSILERKISWKWSFYCSSIAGIVAFPWFWWVKKVSGMWMPSSGTASEGLITVANAWDRIAVMLNVFLFHLITPWAYVEMRFRAMLIIFIIATLLVIVLKICTNETIILFFKRIGFAWLICLFSPSVIYLIFFDTIHFYERYTTPSLVFIIPASALLVQSISKLRSAFFIKNFLIFFPVGLFFWLAFLNLHGGTTGNSHAISTHFVREHFPQAKVGAFQSGVMGFFNENVVNLDGKQNYKIFSYFNRKKSALHEYLDHDHIKVLIDWPSVIYEYIDRPIFLENWVMCDSTIPNEVSFCFQRKILNNE